MERAGTFYMSTGVFYSICDSGFFFLLICFEFRVLSICQWWYFFNDRQMALCTIVLPSLSLFNYTRNWVVGQGCCVAIFFTLGSVSSQSEYSVWLLFFLPWGVWVAPDKFRAGHGARMSHVWNLADCKAEEEVSRLSCAAVLVLQNWSARSTKSGTAWLGALRIASKWINMADSSNSVRLITPPDTYPAFYATLNHVSGSLDL